MKSIFFAEYLVQYFSLAAAVFFSRSRLRGAQGGRLYTTAQVWVPAGLRGVCFARLKSRNLVSNRGIAFRPARANQACANPLHIIFSLFFTFLLLFLK